MEKELDPSLIKATQTSLGKYVKRPPLSEKLLKKPPFRFLHDIVTSVLKTTGFFEGLFEKDELISDNVKDRESKISFLNKVINVVGLTTGKALSAKPSKIVAGQEPDKTNELLQCLAQALDNNLSSDEAVKKFKEGTKPSQMGDSNEKVPAKQIKKSIDTKKLTSRSNEKLTSQKKEQKDYTVKNGNKDRVSKSKDRESNKIKHESPPKVTSQRSKIINKKTQVENANQQHMSNLQSKEESSIKSIKNEDKSMTNKNDNKDDLQKQTQIIEPKTEAILPEQDEVGMGKLDSSYTIAENDLNSSLSSQDLMESSNKFEEIKYLENNTAPDGDPIIVEKDNIEKNMKEEDKVIDYRERSQEETIGGKIQNNIFIRKDSNPSDTEIKHQDRVSSAKNNETISNIVRPTSVRPSSSRPGAPRFRDKHGTTQQGTENVLMGKVNIIIESTPKEEEEDTSIIIVEQQEDQNMSIEQSEQLISNQHGHLVQQILESQKEFSHKTEIEWQFGAQKAREASYQEIEQVRFNIQALSRAANPLGKLLDHIQEDVEVMRQELQQWRRTYEETSKDLLKQKAANDDFLLPLHSKIKQLDADIKEKQDKIDDLKIVIHKNSSRIEKLLASGSVQ